MSLILNRVGASKPVNGSSADARASVLAGYFNRDDLFEQFLSEFNDYFPKRDEVTRRLLNVFSYIDECGFTRKSRIWKRSDLFTACIQFDQLLAERKAPTALEALEKLQRFYDLVDSAGVESTEPYISLYAKASIQASNDRLNRLRRGVIVDAILTGCDPTEVLTVNNLI